MSNQDQVEPSIIRSLISLSLGLSLLTLAWLLMDPHVAAHARQLASCLSHCLYWANAPLATVLLVLALWMGLGARGRTPVLAEQPPAFSRITWLAMLLTAGVGSSLVFSAGLEPARILATSGAQPTPANALAALAQAQFHWGLHAWTWALLCALIIGAPGAGRSPSNLYSSRLPWSRRHQARQQSFGILVDLALLLGPLFALLATLPRAARLLTEGLAQLMGTPLGPMISAIILIAIIVLAALSALAGLARGIRPMALASSLLVLALMVFVWIGGDALAGIKLVIASLGEYPSRLVSLSFSPDFFTGPFPAPFPESFLEPFRTPLGSASQPAGDIAPADWLGQDFIRWMLAAPLVGLFIARISCGRPARELLIGGLLIPPLVALLWISLAGGLLLRPAVAGVLPLDSASLDTISTWGLFAQLPLAPVALALALLAALGLVVAMLDSSLYALAAITTSGAREPSPRMRLYWSLALGLLSLGFLLIQPPHGDMAAQAIAMLFGVGTLVAILALSLSNARALVPRTGDRIAASFHSGPARLSPGVNRGDGVVPHGTNQNTGERGQHPEGIRLEQVAGDADIGQCANTTGGDERQPATQQFPPAQAHVAVGEEIIQEEIGRHGDQGGERLPEQETTSQPPIEQPQHQHVHHHPRSANQRKANKARRNQGPGELL
jgi:glycine betaine transporter